MASFRTFNNRLLAWNDIIDWSGLCENPLLTFSHVRKNPDLPWDWCVLSKHPNITFEDMQSLSDKPWDYWMASANPNITMRHVENHPELDWSWFNLSANPSITFDDVVAHQYEPWDWIRLSRHPMITIDRVMQTLDLPWTREYLIRHPNITFEDITSSYDDMRPSLWDLRFLGFNHNVSFEQAMSALEWEWDMKKNLQAFFYALSGNPKITINDVLRNRREPWDWDQLCKNPSIQIDDIVKMLFSKEIEQGIWNCWNLKNVSLHPKLTLDWIAKHPCLKWDWFNISAHRNVTLEQVKDHPELPWMWEGLSVNPNITLDFVEQNRDKPWLWYELCKQPAFLMPTSAELREWWAAKRIGAQLYESFTNPDYAMCRARLLSEFKSCALTS